MPFRKSKIFANEELIVDDIALKNKNLLAECCFVHQFCWPQMDGWWWLCFCPISSLLVVLLCVQPQHFQKCAKQEDLL